MSKRLLEGHQVVEQIGHVLFVELLFQSFGHDRYTRVDQFVDVRAKHDVAFSFGASKRDAVGRFAIVFERAYFQIRGDPRYDGYIRQNRGLYRCGFSS